MFKIGWDETSGILGRESGETGWSINNWGVVELGKVALITGNWFCWYCCNDIDGLPSVGILSLLLLLFKIRFSFELLLIISSTFLVLFPLIFLLLLILDSLLSEMVISLSFRFEIDSFLFFLITRKTQQPIITIIIY